MFQNVVFSVSELNDLRNAGKCDSSVAYQREIKNAWLKPEYRGLVADSMLRGFSIGTIYTVLRPDGIYEFLDGKQRLHFLATSIDGTLGFAGVEADESCNKVLQEWTKENRDKFMAYKIPFVVFSGMDDSDRRLQFERLQAGIPLSKMESRRGYILNVVGHPVFKDCLNSLRTVMKGFGDKAVTNSVLEETLLQALSYLAAENLSWGGAEVVTALRGVKADTLDKALLVLHTRVVSVVAMFAGDTENEIKLMNRKSHIAAMLCTTKVIEFDSLAKFIYRAADHSAKGLNQTELKNACGSGSAKAENVKTRIAVFQAISDKIYSLNTAKKSSPVIQPVKGAAIPAEYAESWGESATVESVAAALAYVLAVGGNDSHPYKSPKNKSLALQYIDKNGRRQTVPLAELSAKV